MQTLEQVIAEVLEELDRPDLIAVARKSARNVIFECHGMAAFQRDMVTSAQVAVTQQTISIALPANFRKLSHVKALDATLEPIDSLSYELKGAKPYLDYYNFVQTVNTYNLQGGACFVQHACVPLPDFVQLVYFAYPTFVVGAETSEVSTDSWLLTYYTEYVKYKLMYKMAALTNSTTMMQYAAQGAESSLYRILSSELHTLTGA